MSERRELVSELMAGGNSERTACRSVGISRSTYRYKGSGEPTDGLEHRIVELSRKHKRYGYRRITAMLRRNGETVNHKRV